MRFQHHAIAIPELTPADRILEATRQLKDAIDEQPKRAPMDELRAIELLQEVMMGKSTSNIPPNSVQKRKASAKALVSPVPVPPKRQSTTSITPKETPNYVSDDDTATTADTDDEWDKEFFDTPAAIPTTRRSRRIESQRQPDSHDSLHRIVALAASETATVPELTVHKRKLTMGYQCANLSLCTVSSGTVAVSLAASATMRWRLS